MKKFTLDKFFGSLALKEGDTSEDKFLKSTLLILSAITSLCGLLWGFIYYFFFGFGRHACLPWSFTIIVGLAIILFIKKKSYSVLVTTYLFAILIIPTLLQISLGGFIQSGAVILWATMAPLGSLLFHRKKALIWFAACILLFIFALIAEKFSNAWAITPTFWSEIVFFGMNITGPFVAIFFTMKYFVTAFYEEQKKVESVKKEVEELNQFTHLINSLSNLNDIFTEISKYIYQEYEISGCWLFLPDEKKEFLSAFKAYSYQRLSADKYNYLMNLKVPLTGNEGGFLYISYQRQKPFYLSKIKKLNFQIDKEIVNTLGLKSLLHVPLIRKKETVGILCFANGEHDLILTKNQIRKLTNLCSQIAGAVYTNYLLEKIEKSSKVTESLNKLIKKVNETTDIELIMETILEFVNDKYGFSYYSLFVLNPKENKLGYASSKIPEYVTKEDKKKYLQDYGFSLEAENKDSIHSNSIQQRRPFYIADTESSIKTEGGKALLKILKHKTLITIPIFLENNPIGTIDFFDIKPIHLNPEDIVELSLLSEQLAGILQGSILLKEIQAEKEKAMQLKIEADQQRQETEELNKLVKSLNEELDLNIIMQKVGKYIDENFEIKYYTLYIINPDQATVSPMIINGPEYIEEVDLDKMRKFKIPVKNDRGSNAFIFKTKKSFFIPNAQSKKVKDKTTEEELFILEKSGLNSVLKIPLILQNEPIGVLDLSNIHKMNLTKEDISRLSILGEQLAGIIYGSNLLKQVQYEKANANLAMIEADKARRETEKLNKVMKNINSVSGLVDIMTFLMYYLEKEFKFRDFFLLLNDEKEKQFVPFSYTSPRNTKEERDYFLNQRISHSGLSGIFAEILEDKKIIYREKDGIFEDDLIALDWIANGRFDYLLLMPLVIYGELIGILFLHSPKSHSEINGEILVKLEKFSDLIAGAIFNARLLKKVEEAREQADQARIEADIEKSIAQVAQKETELERLKSEKLLLNILPKDVAKELKEKGFAEPELYESVSVMFTDFKGFTQIAEKLTPQELIKDLDACFIQFDKISERFNLEKLKTIGDSYMCAGGIPRKNTTHAIDCALAALEIQAFMNLMKQIKEERGFPYWELRLGIHTGPLIAGVIGEKKFAYDVWGDTVNTASRMESSGTPGKINISHSVYELVKNVFDCEYRGEVSAKNKGMVKMYYLNRIKPEFSKDDSGMVPNGKFWEIYGGFGF